MAKVLITVDDTLLRRIDRTARERGLTRSAYFGELARWDLERATGPGTQPEVRAALTRLDKLFAGNAAPGDATALVREERDRRG
jgi:metal-responsive CopG/Arc/MetJ family transcriptional regulator